MTEDLSTIAKTAPSAEPTLKDVKPEKISKNDYLHKKFFHMKKAEAKIANFKNNIQNTVLC